MPVYVDLAAVDPGARDPAAVLGKNAADLVDIDFPFALVPSFLVDLDSNRKGLLRYDNGIEIGLDGGTEPVVQRLDHPRGWVSLSGNVRLKLGLPGRERVDGVDLAARKRIGCQADDNMPVGTCQVERPIQKALVAVMQGIECTPYHNLHVPPFLISYVIMHMDAKVSGDPLFRAGNATITGDVAIGAQVGIWFGAVVRADKDRIVIGDRSNIQDNCVVHTSKGFPVLIGSDVSVGHGAILHGCRIGNRVLVGMGAIVLNGAVIGDGSVIGAGAVVKEGMDVPERSVVVGVPGKVVKPASDEQQQNILKNAASYVELAGEYARHD